MIAAPTPELRSCVITSTRASPAPRAAAAVPSRDASSTTKILSTNGGTPAIVVGTSASSSYAGTTTATVLPSSTNERLPEERGDHAEDEPEKRRDDDGVAPAARRRLHRRRAGEHLRPLDLLRLDQELLRLQLVVEHVTDLHGQHGPPHRVTGRRPAADRVELLLVVGDALLQRADLEVRVRSKAVDDDAREGVRGRGGAPARGRLHRYPHERVPGRANRGAAGSGRDRLRRDMSAEVAWAHPGPRCGILDRRLGARDRRRRRRIGLRALQEDAPDRAVGGAEVDRRARLPHFLPAERDHVADERAGDQPEQGQPPVRDERAPVSAEIDFLLGAGIGVARAQGAATLTEAHSH